MNVNENSIKQLEDEEITSVNLDEYEHLDEEQVAMLERRNKQLAKEQRKKDEDAAAVAAAMKASHPKQEVPVQDIVRSELPRTQSPTGPVIDTIVSTQYLRGCVVIFTAEGKIFELSRDDKSGEYGIAAVGQLDL